MRELVVKEWDGKDLEGRWMVTYKMDGILCRKDESGEIVSKNNKSLYNLPETNNFLFAEVFCGSWNETWSIISASKSPRREVRQDEIYPIYPKIDPRLVHSFIDNPTSEQINKLLKFATEELGVEGLVLRKDNLFFIKVKPVQTLDLKVKGITISEAASHKGLMKELITDLGKVGKGFTREQRKEFLDPKYIGSTVEVEIIGGFTKSGKMRHSSFIRLRPDK